MDVSPEPILKTATGFMAAKHLFAASEIRLFEVLSNGPLTLDNLALKTRVASQRVRIVADAMVAIGLLTRGPNGYANTPVVSTYLTGGAGTDLRPFLKFLDTVSYPAWNDYVGAISSGTVPARVRSELDTRIIGDGVSAFTTSAAVGLAGVVEIPADAKILDVAAGSGTFLKAILGAHPRATGTLFDLPPVAHLARAEIQGPVASRVDIVGGDAFKVALPKGHDVVVVANFMHLWSTEKNLQLLEHVRTAVEPGARVLLVDFWTDANHTEPNIAAMLAGDFLTTTGEGDVYSVKEATAWLDKTGFQFVSHNPLVGAQSVIVAEAI